MTETKLPLHELWVEYVFPSGDVPSGSADRLAGAVKALEAARRAAEWAPPTDGEDGLEFTSQLSSQLKASASARKRGRIIWTLMASEVSWLDGLTWPPGDQMPDELYRDELVLRMNEFLSPIPRKFRHSLKIVPVHLRSELYDYMQEGLYDSEAGQDSGMFKPIRSGRLGHWLYWDQFRRSAVLHAYHLKGRGSTLESAYDEVAAQIGFDCDALIEWRKKMPKWYRDATKVAEIRGMSESRRKKNGATLSAADTPMSELVNEILDEPLESFARRFRTFAETDPAGRRPKKG